ncbi:MAG: Fic family protein [Aestuariivita sp.]|nr:Fic family protein [Aestuariivita sp.]
MIIHDLTGQETHTSYQNLAASNELRHYEFLRSIVEAALALDKQFLSQTVLKALNFHAIACLHSNAGMYRPCRVTVGNKNDFPEPWQIPDLMDDFVNSVNRRWTDSDALYLAAFVLWRLNWIHPFINGNGRIARAACLFVLCLKSGGWPPYSPILPELIRQNRDKYIDILKVIDKSNCNGELDLQPIIVFLFKLLQQQVDSEQTPQ